jgi:cytochrome c-type biogenesis protein CcsB
LSNISFFLLFLSTLFYWTRLIILRNSWIYFLGKLTVLLGNCCLTALLLIRWITIGHLPLSNLYESSISLCWSLILTHILIDLKSKGPWIGATTAPSAMFLNGFCILSLPRNMQKATALVPALQSNWLLMHVSMMIFSYAALLSGSLLSIAFLVLDTLKIEEFKNYDLNTRKEIIKNRNSILNLGLVSNLIEELDYWSYRIINVGFPFLTLGILSGAVWANETWGSYWNWDPKETWALITWFIFAIYLHVRINKGWKGRKVAFIGVLGFFVIWVCYLGVNLLGKGLHSYGWFN